MDQSKKKADSVNHESQFEFMGRWVNKAHFRSFVYDKQGGQRLANSYDEFVSLTSSGLWFASKEDASKKEDVPPVEAKKKYAVRTDSK